MRRVVISGSPPVQILDVTGTLEVFSNAPGYSVEVAAPDGSHALETNRGIALSGAIPIQDVSGRIDTLVIAAGPAQKAESTTRRTSHGSRPQRHDPDALPPSAPALFFWRPLDS